MGNIIRLDKFLADMSVGTRSQVKVLVNKGKIKVNNMTVKDPSLKVNPDNDVVEACGKQIVYTKFEYYMLNKPSGYITATYDEKDKTVLDLIEEKSRKDLFPVGRLDKDTEGLLLITNDGELAHNLLSPRKHVDKTYYVETDSIVTEDNLSRLEKGITLEENFITMPARVKVLDIKNVNAYEITIKEGKYHQVKRMFSAVGSNVTYLKRISMGSLKLDNNLSSGEYRSLTDKEINQLKNN